MKKTVQVSLFITIVLISLIIIVSLVFSSQNTVGIKDFDTGDIVQMNIGAEMPELLYADTKIVIIYGTCGVVVYSVEEMQLKNRISFSDFERMDISHPECKVSVDGKTLYISEEAKTLYKYVIVSGKLYPCTKITEDLFSVETVHLPSIDKLKEYIDFNFILGDQIVQTDNKTIYLRANNDWSMNSLQIVVYNSKTHKSEIYKMFDNL
ncbi:MAG: hypothetical protein IJA02_10600 [Clostridia bacterium]|nr:hypothetical protein [Clostridia bacterium]